MMRSPELGKQRAEPRGSYGAVHASSISQRWTRAMAMPDIPDAVRYALRPATPGDSAFIHGLRESGLREHVERIWGWDEDDQRERFARRFAADAYQIIVVEGRDVGAVSVAWSSDEVFLSDLEIEPEWRGQGLGTAVLGDILAEARRLVLPVRLQVLQGNPARRLYERLGFEAVGESATHVAMRVAAPRIRDPAVDAQSAR